MKAQSLGWPFLPNCKESGSPTGPTVLEKTGVSYTGDKQLSPKWLLRPKEQ